MVSRRCVVDEVPGISRMFGERCSSQARATDAHDRRDRLRLGDLFRRRVAQSEVLKPHRLVVTPDEPHHTSLSMGHRRWVLSPSW